MADIPDEKCQIPEPSNLYLDRLLEVDGSLTATAIAPGDPDYLYLLRQEGLIHRYHLPSKKLDLTPFLDLTNEVSAVYREKPMMVKFPDERGLLRLAFHPGYGTNGSLFEGVFVVIHSELANPELYDQLSHEQVPDPADHMTCIAQYRYQKGNIPDQTKQSRINILCVPEPQANHNGGGLLFGPDGFLWIGLGDGGGANDEHGPLLDPNDTESFLGTAQDLQSLHGKILRLEVVQPMPQKVPYLIPQDNPFAKDPTKGRPEIAAGGVR